MLLKFINHLPLFIFLWYFKKISSFPQGKRKRQNAIKFKINKMLYTNFIIWCKLKNMSLIYYNYYYESFIDICLFYFSK